MTESLTDPRASQSFIIVSQTQMNALSMLLFELIRASHQHNHQDSRIDRPTAADMHKLLAAFEGMPVASPPVPEE